MLSSQIDNDDFQRLEGKLIILCPEDREQAIRKALARYVGAFWDDGQIRLLSIPRSYCGDGPRVTAQLKELLGKVRSITHVIRYKEVMIDDKALRGKALIFNTSGSKNLYKETLPRVLRAIGADWLSLLEAKFSGRWRHGTLDRKHIENWIEQCRIAGNNAWVAERVLKVLDFWSDDRLRASLRITEEGLRDFDCVCTNRFLPGKSADAISNLIQKQLESSGLNQRFDRVMDFAEAIDSSSLNRILFIEDCLITGNEMVRVLMALQGQQDTFGKPRARKLKAPEQLRRKNINLRFTVASNGGLAYLDQYLKEQELSNIQVDEVVEPGLLTTLTAEGLSALAHDELYDSEGSLVNPDLHIARVLFAPLNWRNKATRDRAMSFCKEIGLQLYRQYLKKENKDWSAKRIEESALGVRSFALALAFQHSVPKETLPLLWFYGPVTSAGKTVNWTALFQNAA